MDLSWDTKCSHVILVGASEFIDESLPTLPSVKNNIDALGKILEDTEIIGIPSCNISVLLNQEYASLTATEIALRAREAFDTLFIYYAGHGKISNSGELLLTVKGTNTKALEASSINFRVIRDAVLNSPAAKKIIIIDSCFSGRAASFMGCEEDIIRANSIEGTYLITSVPKNDLAQAFDDEKKFTAFTSKLIRVLMNGIKNGRNWLTINDIYKFVRDESTTFTEPQRVINQSINEFRFAINKHQISPDFDIENQFLFSNQRTIISRVPLDIIKKFEAFNNLHSQRFIVVSNIYLDKIGLSPGDWIEIEIIQNSFRVHYEYCTIFPLPFEGIETSIYMPLVMRNLLFIQNFLDDSGHLIENSRLKIKKFLPEPINFWEITSDDYICGLSIPSDLRDQSFDQRLVSIRNLEFDQLQLNTLSEITLEFFNDVGDYFAYDARAIRFVDNPGRAVIGLSRNMFEEAFSMEKPFKVRLYPCSQPDNNARAT